MSIGFGIRIMPGVRISASTRGIRAGIGPRAARVNIGTRGVGLSTGVGPFYASTGTGQRRRSVKRSLSTYESELRRAKREQEIAEIAELERQLVSMHLEEFPAAQPQRAPESAPVDRSAVLKDLRK